MTTEALPVRVALAGLHATPVRDYVDSRGWQVVDPATEGLVPPALTLTDTAAGDHGARDEPVVLVVTAEDDPVRAAAVAIHCRAAVAVRWPDDRADLPGLADRLVAAPRAGAVPAIVRVAGAAGGVGTSTVALGLGGLAAWRGRRVLAAVRGDVPSPVEATVSAADLSSAGLWEAASPARGVPGLRAVRVTGPPGEAQAPAGGADLVIHDLGVDADDADVLVLRRDAAGRAALERSVAGTAVLVDHGPAAAPALREAAAGRRVVVVPFSVRVARAGLARRVPAGLPGRWLRGLAPVLRGVT